MPTGAHHTRCDRAKCRRRFGMGIASTRYAAARGDLRSPVAGNITLLLINRWQRRTEDNSKAAVFSRSISSAAQAHRWDVRWALGNRTSLNRRARSIGRKSRNCSKTQSFHPCGAGVACTGTKTKRARAHRCGGQSRRICLAAALASRNSGTHSGIPRYTIDAGRVVPFLNRDPPPRLPQQ